MKRYLLFFCAWASLSLFGSNVANAQESEGGNEQLMMAVVAEVNIVDSSVLEQNDHNFKVKFSLDNGNGAQSDVRYGINLVEKNEKGERTVVFQKIFEEKESLAEHTKIDKEIEFKIPQYISGKYDLAVVSENGNGLSLGYNTVGEVELQGDGKYVKINKSSCYLHIKDNDAKYNIRQGVDVAPNEQLVLSCEVQNMSSETMNVKSELDTYMRTVFGDEVEANNKAQSISFASKEKKVFDLEISKPDKPQAYDAVLYFVDDSGETVSDTVNAHYVVQGKSASISNLQLDKSFYKKNENIKATFLWGISADNFPGSRSGGSDLGDVFYSLSITDKDSQDCIDKISHKKINLMDALTVSDGKALIDCQDPNASLQLEDANGNVLAKETFNFKSKPETVDNNLAVNNTPGSFDDLAWYIIGFITLVGFLVILAYVIKNKSFKILFFVLLGGSFFLGSNAKANTVIVWQNQTLGKRAECNLNLSSTNIPVNGSFYGESSGCKIVQCLNWMDMQAYIGGTQVFGMNIADDDKLSGMLTFSEGDSYYQSSAWSGRANFTAPATPGSYSKEGKVEFHHYDFRGSKTTNLGYTVYSPAPVNGSCGTRNTSYASTVTAWPVGSTLCSAGSASANPAFPAAGSSVNWSCNGSYGGTHANCTASRASLVTNGACGTASKIYAANVSSFGSDTFCASGTPSGTPASFPAQGAKTATWSCLGTGTGTSATNCQAGRKLATPTSVDLQINGSNGPLTVNKDTDMLNITWASNGNKCEGSGYTWLTPTAHAVNLPGSGSDTRSPRQTGFPASPDTYTVECWNDNGDASLQSDKASDSVIVSAACEENLNPAWSACSAACGGGDQTRTITYSNCTSSTVQHHACNTFDCPSWQEVNP